MGGHWTEPLFHLLICKVYAKVKNSRTWLLIPAAGIQLATSKSPDPEGQRYISGGSCLYSSSKA